MRFRDKTIKAAQVLATVTNTAYYPTGKTCEKCGGNDAFISMTLAEVDRGCLEETLKMCSTKKGSARYVMLTECAKMCEFLGVDLKGIEVRDY